VQRGGGDPVVALAALLGPKGPTGPPDPTLSGANPRPEWPFLWLFALLSLSPPAAETFHYPDFFRCF